jgi:hypothetical protein
MAKELTGVEAAKLSRSMSQEDREAAIDASQNVIGYARFMQQHNQVAASRAYHSLSDDDDPKLG